MKYEGAKKLKVMYAICHMGKPTKNHKQKISKINGMCSFFPVWIHREKYRPMVNSLTCSLRGFPSTKDYSQAQNMTKKT